MKHRGWHLTNVVAYTAACESCGHDLLSDDEFCCWMQPDGVEAVMDHRDECPKCHAPLNQEPE